MKKKLEYLGVSAEQYEQMYIGSYMRWCERLCKSPSELQSILANSSVNKFYNAELAKCEEEFVKLFSRYEGSTTVSATDAKILYTTCTFKMYSIRPIALLLNSKKTNVYAN